MPIERFEIDTDQWAVVPLVPSKRQLEAAAFNLCNNFGAEFVQANETFARSVYLEFLLAAVQPKPKDDKPVIPDFVFDVIQQAKDSICAGGLAENAQHERSIVEPYLDGIIDELLAAAPRPEPVQSSFDPAEYRIPCDVKLPPNTRISRGCPLSTVIAAMEARRDGIEGIPVAESQRFSQQPAQPIPTSERPPTAADADEFGFLIAFHVELNEWRLWHASVVLKNLNSYSHWQPTGLTRPAEPAVCAECNGSGHASDQSGEACTYCHGTGQ